MTAYLDSSALIKLYVAERGSNAVARYVVGLTQPIPFSHLHELEIENSLRLKVFRREASRRTVFKCIAMLRQDLASGVLHRPMLNWPDVFHRAAELSQRHSIKLGCRSLDLLHVASALLLDLQRFLTYDDRQASLVSKVGLDLVIF